MVADMILCSRLEVARAIIRSIMHERGVAVLSDSCVDAVIADIRKRGMASETLKYCKLAAG